MSSHRAMTPREALVRQPHARRYGTLLVVLLLGAMIATSLPASAATAGVVTRGKAASGAVALTFDDGWNRAACARIGSTLRSSGAKGTFFINGNHLKSAPATWRRILRGHAVANHTRSHRDLTRETDRVVRKQLRENERLHEQILGRPMLKLVRPPYGAHDRRVRRIAGELGYRNTVLWSVDTQDWRSYATVGSVIRRATGAPAGSIILMHCARDVTAAALPAIVRHYKARGIELAALNEVLWPGGKPRASANRNTRRNNRPAPRVIDAQVKPSRADRVAGTPPTRARPAIGSGAARDERGVAKDGGSAANDVATTPLGPAPQSTAIAGADMVVEVLAGLCVVFASRLPEPYSTWLPEGRSCETATLAASPADGRA